ncbi:MAG: hypothetical protein ACK55Z_04625, partial [bacterium]
MAISGRPASVRRSKSEVMIVASPPASRQASPTLRTLCPTCSPASNRSCINWRATSVTAAWST